MKSKTQNVLQRHLCSLQSCSDKLPLCGQLETIEITPSVLPHCPDQGMVTGLVSFSLLLLLLLLWSFRNGGFST